jgi:hypothetical protein
MTTTATQLAAFEAQAASAAEPVAWLYTLEYGASIADAKASPHQLRYPFGVCGADYSRANSDGVSYVRETPLYATPVAQAEPRKPLTEDALTELIAENMHSVYHCTRVWEAWHVGTMSQDDFESYADSASPRELAGAILEAIASQQPKEGT